MKSPNQQQSRQQRSREPNAAHAEGSARPHRGSLRSKLVVSLGAMFLVFLVVDEVIRRQVINPSFVRLEHTGAVQDANRVLAAIDVEAEYMTEICRQSATSLDPLELRRGDRESPPEVDDTRNRWSTQRFSWVAIIGADGTRHWLHPDGGPSVQEISEPIFPAIDRLVNESKGQTFKGKARVANQLFMFSGAPIEPKTESRSDYLVIGRALDADMIRAIRKRTQVDFSMQLPRRPTVTKPYDVWEADRETLVVETPLLGIDGEPLANLFVQVPREITMRSEITNTVARNTFVFGVIAALLFLLMLLQRIVVGPITAIREHTEQIAEQGLNASSLALSKNDEIGELAEAFQRMTLKLSKTQMKLADASHAAGMSQVADTVIHNVGNVLTNVNSLIDTAQDCVKSLRIEPLDKLANRMQQAGDDEELQAAAPSYLRGLAATLQGDRQELASLLTTLSDNVSHIHDVIRDQRRHTLTDVNKTRFPVKGILTEAIDCCRSRLDKEKIAVTLPPADDVEVDADRSLLLQIVINIISNARHAIAANPELSPALRIDLEYDEQTVKIRFGDSGCGMSPETLQRVFEAHFTTRDDGSGLGLHFCAIAMKRQGGSISAESDGEGQGSTFILTLPRAGVTATADTTGQLPSLAGSTS